MEHKDISLSLSVCLWSLCYFSPAQSQRSIWHNRPCGSFKTPRGWCLSVCLQGPLLEMVSLCSSSLAPIKCGIPQGSILGQRILASPLLYLWNIQHVGDRQFQLPDSACSLKNHPRVCGWLIPPFLNSRWFKMQLPDFKQEERKDNTSLLFWLLSHYLFLQS